MRVHWKRLLQLVTATLGSALLLHFISLKKSFHNEIKYKAALEETKIILLWHTRFWKTKVIDTNACGSCVFSSDRTMINHPQTAAVLFRSEQIDPNSMPPSETRRQNQLYIWSSGESPPSLFHLRKKWLFWEDKYKFNATMCFRRDSTLYHPYGTASEAYSFISEKGYAKNIKSLLSEKRKLAVAVVSNCDSVPAAKIRYQLLQNIVKAGLKADLYGKCFSNLNIDKENRVEFEHFLSKYKFYFAFENSHHCKDYITEKFYRNALYIGVVPVVWGARKEDYEAVAPPGSFIHVEDFSSVQELAEYLNYLDKNDTAYLEYFRWYSKDIYGSSYRDFSYCLLCQWLHDGKLWTRRNSDRLSYYTESKAHFAGNEEVWFSANVNLFNIPSLRSWFYYGNRDCLKTQLRLLGNETKVH